MKYDELIVEVPKQDGRIAQAVRGLKLYEIMIKQTYIDTSHRASGAWIEI